MFNIRSIFRKLYLSLTIVSYSKNTKNKVSNVLWLLPTNVSNLSCVYLIKERLSSELKSNNKWNRTTLYILWNLYSLYIIIKIY